MRIFQHDRIQGRCLNPPQLLIFIHTRIGFEHWTVKSLVKVNVFLDDFAKIADFGEFVEFLADVSNNAPEKSIDKNIDMTETINRW